MILYILALGSPTHPGPGTAPGARGPAATTGTRSTATPTSSSRRCSGTSTRTAGSTSATSGTPTCSAQGITYFENSRRATLAQRAYCIANPGALHRLRRQPVGPDGGRRPATATTRARRAAGAERQRHDHADRGDQLDRRSRPRSCIPVLAQPVTTPTAADVGALRVHGRVQPDARLVRHRLLGIDQGPIIIMIENYRTGSRCGIASCRTPTIQPGSRAPASSPSIGVDPTPDATPAVRAVPGRAQSVRGRDHAALPAGAAGSRARSTVLRPRGPRGRAAGRRERAAGLHAVRFDVGRPAGRRLPRAPRAGGASSSTRCVLLR